jgi:hypothetical protein
MAGPRAVNKTDNPLRLQRRNARHWRQTLNTAFRVAPRNPESELSLRFGDDATVPSVQASAPSGNTCYVQVPVPVLNWASSFHQRTSRVFYQHGQPARQHTLVNARIWDEGRCWVTAMKRTTAIWHFASATSQQIVRVSGARMFASCKFFSWSHSFIVGNCEQIILLFTINRAC